MTFTIELIKLLVEKKDSIEYFQSKIEEALNKLLETERTCLLNDERYDNNVTVEMVTITVWTSYRHD